MTNRRVLRLLAASLATVYGVIACTSQPSTRTPLNTPPPVAVKTLPDGGREIFPAHRVVALYGTAGDPDLGALGVGSPDQAARRLLQQAKVYERPDRHVLPAFELIATVAQASSRDGTYNGHLSDTRIRTYLAAARKVHALLIIDVQPGRAAFLPEVRRYERFLTEPDVGLALDSEWKMGPQEVPGRTIGGTDAASVNAVSAYLVSLIDRNRLPQKLLIVHQFTADMIAHRDRVLPRRGLAITFHVDGFGGRAAKLSKYHLLAVQGPPFYNGFKLFYHQDVDMFSAQEVLRMKPAPDLITYE